MRGSGDFDATNVGEEDYCILKRGSGQKSIEGVTEMMKLIAY